MAAKILAIISFDLVLSKTISFFYLVLSKTIEFICFGVFYFDCKTWFYLNITIIAAQQVKKLEKMIQEKETEARSRDLITGRTMSTAEKEADSLDDKYFTSSLSKMCNLMWSGGHSGGLIYYSLLSIMIRPLKLLMIYIFF